MPKTQVLEQHPHPKYPRLVVDRRSNSRFYQARTYLDGKLVQKSTKTPHLPTAFKLAEDWYKRLLRASVSHGKKHPIEQLTTDPTIAELFRAYHAELDPRKQTEALKRWGPIANFWRTLTLSEVSPQTFKDFYKWRKNVTPHTRHKDVVTIRQVLKYAIEQGLLSQLPVIPSVGKIATNPRPWLTGQELEHLIRVAEERIKNAPNARTAGQRVDCLDMIQFLTSSMLRIGEIRKLHFHDCRIEKNNDGDKMLLCEVTGKNGTRTVVAHLGAVQVYEDRLKTHETARADLEAGDTLDDRIFPSHSRDAFRSLLEAAGLRMNDQEFTRNLKSLRATSISSQLLRDPDMNLTVVARNAGTSVQMIDTYYAKRLTAEMFKHKLSALPEEVSARGEKKRRAAGRKK